MQVNNAIFGTLDVEGYVWRICTPHNAHGPQIPAETAQAIRQDGTHAEFHLLDQSGTHVAAGHLWVIPRTGQTPTQATRIAPLAEFGIEYGARKIHYPKNPHWDFQF